MMEQYSGLGPGYTPFLIRPGWQVAELNYAPELRLGAVERVERHAETDEVFVALRGRPVLACVEFDRTGQAHYECAALEARVTYNIPAGAWHTIAMAPDDVVLIVEAAQTHRADVRYRELTDAEKVELNARMRTAKE